MKEYASSSIMWAVLSLTFSVSTPKISGFISNSQEIYCNQSFKFNIYKNKNFQNKIFEKSIKIRWYMLDTKL